MADEQTEIDLSHTTCVIYKDRTGALKELHVKMPMDPAQRTFTFQDLQMLARQITQVLKEDAQ